MKQGMQQPQRGLMRIDKLDLRELDIAHVRQNIGVVLVTNLAGELEGILSERDIIRRSLSSPL